MGVCYSKLEREEMVSRCKARRRYMKQLAKARQALACAYTSYLRSLRTTGSALLQFAQVEATLHHHRLQHHRLPPLIPSPPPPPPRPGSPSSDTWTSVTASSLPPPPPPPPSSWDFWDPFVPPSPRSVPEEEWEAITTTTIVTASVTAPPSVVSGCSKDASTELAMVVSRSSKDLVEIIKELDDYFLKAADSGAHVSLLLESSSSGSSFQGTTSNSFSGCIFFFC